MNKDILTGEIQARLAHLRFNVESQMDGPTFGIHRSPHHGQSVEFSEHKDYSPGDEIQNIDWKVFGRTDKYYVKQFENETNLSCHFILDSSGSMNYSGESISKFEYAVRFIAMLSYVMLRQKDSVGLVIVNDKVRRYLPPRSSGSYIKEIITACSTFLPESTTDLILGINAVLPHLKKRGVVFIFSDLFLDINSFFSTVLHLRSYKQEVLLFHVLDHSELIFPFKDFANFKCMESENSYLAESKAMKKVYLKELNSHLSYIKKECFENYIKYYLLDTSFKVEEEVFGFLSHGRHNGI